MPGAGGSNLLSIPSTQLQQDNLHRLIPSRFAESEDSVLAPISNDTGHLQELFELDNSVNQRLLAESNRDPGIGIDELVFGVPNFRIINAAFSYKNPEGNRFNGPHRGAWYCSFDIDTAIAEVVFHQTVALAEIGAFNDRVTYQSYLADMHGEFHDLRTVSDQSKYLDPSSYLHSQLLGEQLLEAGSLGIIYPSVRKANGVNLVCFRPATVSNVRKATKFEMTWSGNDSPIISILG